MHIKVGIAYGMLGICLGWLSYNVSQRLMKRKKGEEYKINEGLAIKICFYLINGVIWFLSGLFIDNVLNALLINFQITLGIVIAYIDIRIRIIPNELVLTIIIVGIIFQTIFYGMYGLIGSIMSMIFIMIVFTTLANFMGMGKVGAGDVKLAGAIGFALGYPLVSTAMGIMAIVLLAYILVGLALRKIKLTTMLPLAPFLAAGYIFSLLSLVFDLGYVL